MSRRFSALVIAAALVGDNAAAAQRVHVPDIHGRPTGAAVIRGRVVDAESGAPLREAQVRASILDSGESWVVRSGADGRYEFARLPAGRYNLSVIKDGYVGLQYGQRAPRQRPQSVQLAEGQGREQIDFRVPKGGVIAGHIIDEFGEAKKDVVVVALASRLANGRRAAVAAGYAGATNDLGEFRIAGLSPGRYYLSARYGGATALPAIDSVPRFAYVPSYYPGTSDPAEAQALAVEAGDQLTGVLFSLVPSRVFQITGVLRSADGLQLNRSSLVLTHPGATIGATDSRAQVWPDGRFLLSNVAPGNHVLNARGTPGGSEQEEFASVPIAVGAADVTGIQITTTKGATIRGEVAFEGNQQRRFDPAGMSVLAIPVSGEIGLGAIAATRLNGDLSFELPGVFGSRLFRVQGAPSGWELKSALMNGKDILDTPVQFEGNETVSSLALTLTDQVSMLSGSVVDTNSVPMPDCTVLVYAEDPSLWTVPSRFIRVAPVGPLGRFQMRALPQGRYLAVALDYLTAEDALDPELLENLRPEGTAFAIHEAERETIRLRLSKLHP